MKKRILRTLSIMIAMALLLTCLPAMAEQTKNDGQLSITFTDKGYKNFDPEGIKIAIYLVARGEYGAWTMESGFEDIDIFTGNDGSTKIDQSMETMQKRIKGSGILPAVTPGFTDDNGNVSFSGLEHGIYLVTLVTNRDGLSMNLMLVATPNKDGETNIRAYAKYEFKKTTTTMTARIPPLTVATKRGERLVPIDDYETALGLGDIQMHVGVCFE